MLLSSLPDGDGGATTAIATAPAATPCNEVVDEAPCEDLLLIAMLLFSFEGAADEFDWPAGGDVLFVSLLWTSGEEKVVIVLKML